MVEERCIYHQCDYTSVAICNVYVYLKNSMHVKYSCNIVNILQMILDVHNIDVPLHQAWHPSRSWHWPWQPIWNGFFNTCHHPVKQSKAWAWTLDLLAYPHHFIYHAVFLLTKKNDKILFRAVLQPRDVGMLIGQSFANLEVPLGERLNPQQIFDEDLDCSPSIQVPPNDMLESAGELVDSYSLIWYDIGNF